VKDVDWRRIGRRSNRRGPGGRPSALFFLGFAIFQVPEI